MAAVGSDSQVETQIKVVGQSGQISLGKHYVGKTLKLERRPDGSILITTVVVVPESQLWTLQEPHRSRIARGMAWAARTPPAETDLDELLARHPLLRGKRRGASKK